MAKDRGRNGKNHTLPKTNSSHLKIDDWKTILSFWKGLFSGYVSFREANKNKLILTVLGVVLWTSNDDDDLVFMSAVFFLWLKKRGMAM